MLANATPKLDIKNLSVSYGQKIAVNQVSCKINPRSVTALIGPSGCGKSTLLRSINRMNDFIQNVNCTGEILLDQAENILASQSPEEIRRKIGMVFQKPNPFPSSIIKNITWGPKIHGFRGDTHQLVQDVLQKTFLWDEVKDQLKKSGLQLSGGQQQRLCIARTLAMQPEIILMDEPCSALDPNSTEKIEELILRLKKQYTVIIVTHNLQQAKRISDFTLFMHNGNLIEEGETHALFTNPHHPLTQDYVAGRFG